MWLRRRGLVWELVGWPFGRTTRSGGCASASRRRSGRHAASWSRSTRQSDAYLFIPLLWASLVALSIPPVVVLADLWIDLATVSTIQLATFLLLSLLFRWTPLKMRLTSKAIKLRRAARAAREQFLAQGVHKIGRAHVCTPVTNAHLVC